VWLCVFCEGCVCCCVCCVRVVCVVVCVVVSSCAESIDRRFLYRALFWL